MYNIYYNNYLIASVDSIEQAQSIVNDEPYGYFTFKYVCNVEDYKHYELEHELNGLESTLGQAE